jgi:predicted nucleotidyltransferase
MTRETRDSESEIARPLEIAREVARIARSLFGDGTEVIWFGSWPQRRALPHSDIDLAISTGAPVPPERMSLLHDAVDDISTLYEIDVVDLHSVGPALREEVLKYGERL